MKKEIKSLRSWVFVALSSALISICAMISIPAPIPFTLQTFGVFFALFFLGGKLGTVSIVLYVCLGAIGLPVFSGFSGGFARLFDAGGGYILGFILAGLVYLLVCSLLPKKRGVLYAAAALAMLSLYICGAMWYSLVYTGTDSLFYVLMLTVFPYVFPDVIKIGLAYVISMRLKKIL